MSLRRTAAEKLALVRFTLGLADVLETGVRESQVDGLILMAEARLLAGDALAATPLHVQRIGALFPS